jgi:hypothetical protein
MKLLGLFFIFFLSHSALAFYTTGESAELVKPNTYHLGIEPQVRISEGTGFNFNGFLDAPFGPEASIRATLGFGQTELFTTIAYKWVPIPDYDRQPAIGGKLEAIYARTAGNSLSALKIHPLISKKFETSFGTLVPYGSIPLALISSGNTSDTSLQLVGGAELYHNDYKQWIFSAELGVNMNKAFSYISGTLTYVMDDQDFDKKKK